MVVQLHEHQAGNASSNNSPFLKNRIILPGILPPSVPLKKCESGGSLTNGTSNTSGNTSSQEANNQNSTTTITNNNNNGNNNNSIPEKNEIHTGNGNKKSPAGNAQNTPQVIESNKKNNNNNSNNNPNNNQKSNSTPDEKEKEKEKEKGKPAELPSLDPKPSKPQKLQRTAYEELAVAINDVMQTVNSLYGGSLNRGINYNLLPTYIDRDTVVCSSIRSLNI